jgi:hypothetical protein
MAATKAADSTGNHSEGQITLAPIFDRMMAKKKAAAHSASRLENSLVET